MTDKKDVDLAASIVSAIATHAVDAYPDECCGFVVRHGEKQQVMRVTNIQDARHADDPRHFPRTSATAYTMGPDSLPVLIAHDRGDLRIEAIYHSHPEHGAYFSAEDCKLATAWGEPLYPDVAQIVVSVCGRQVKQMRIYRWDRSAQAFAEGQLEAI
jgi:proteasome lid subunit RPN8/RPN11